MFISLTKLLFESDDITRKISGGKSSQVVDMPPPESISDPIGAIKKISADGNKDNLQKAKEIYSIASAKYPKIGYGSNRTVFDLGGERVLKVSYVDPGDNLTYNVDDAVSQTQNEGEVCSKAKNEGLVPELYYKDANGLFLILEKAESINEIDLANYFGFNSFKEFTKALNKAIHDKKPASSTEAYEESKDKFAKWIEIMNQCKYALADMTNINNWGRSKDGALVMVDTGLSIENAGRISRRQKDIRDIILRGQKSVDIGSEQTLIAQPQGTTAKLKPQSKPIEQEEDIGFAQTVTATRR